LNGSLLVTPSRRTGSEVTNALANELNGIPHYLWNLTGENPYFGLLGLADFIVVTCDSVNMVSEAASTGKPVYIAMLPGGSGKTARFLASLRDMGVTRPFDGTVTHYTYAPVDDKAAVVQRVRQLFFT